MKRILISTTIILLINFLSFSQTGNWDVYMAQYENGPGSVTLNMDLLNIAPNKSLPYILITGVTY